MCSGRPEPRTALLAIAELPLHAKLDLDQLLSGMGN
jgi:hypothetical protein